MASTTYRKPTGGYAGPIGTAIGDNDQALVALVEDFMRNANGSVLDHLSSGELTKAARQAHLDIGLWAAAGTVDGFTLADYCRISLLELPAIEIVQVT